MSDSPSQAPRPHQLLLVDKNQLRGAAARGVITEARLLRSRVLIIDTVFVEIARDPDWRNHFERDFRDWTADADLLAVSHGIGTLMRRERDDGVSALGSLVDAQTTALFQDLVRGLGASGAAGLMRYEAAMEAARNRLTTPGAMLDEAQNLNDLRRMVDVWWQHGLWWTRDPVAARRLLQREVQDPAARSYDLVGIAALSDGVLGGIRDALSNVGFSDLTAQRLTAAPSVTLLVWCAREALTLLYFAQGRRGQDLQNQDRETNQVLDTSYLGLGLACERLLTNDQLLRLLDAGLRTAVAIRWPNGV
jgi:hypothetical protein